MKLARRKADRSDFEVVVTSMLDINFLLIMFFLMTAHFQLESHAALELPQERGEDQALVDESGLVINVTGNGEIIVKGAAVPMENLRGLVQEKIDRLPEGETAQSMKLLIRADRNASTRHLNRVVTMLHELGVGLIRIGTEIPI